MATDDFNRADDADLGPNWQPVTVAAMCIVSNEVRPGLAGDPCAERYSADTPTDDQKSSCTLSVIEISLNFGSGPACRMSAVAEQFYYAYANTNASGHFQYAKDIDTVKTQLGAYAAGAAPVTGDNLRIVANGTRISIEVNDVEVAFTTDASLAAGQCGLWGWEWSDQNEIDNWAGGNLIPAEPEPSLTWLVPIAAA